MSLESLRQLRRARKRPEEVVTIVIGPRPSWKADSPAFVHIAADADVEALDLRPLIGLWVAVFLGAPARAVALRVMDAAVAVGAKLYAAADEIDVHMLSAEPTEKHVRNMRAGWELLCR